MGNKTAEEQLQITYIRSIDDANFGEIQLFRKNEIQCIMKKTFTFVNQDPSAKFLNQFLDFHKVHKSNPALAQILHLERLKQKQLCIQYEKVHLFIEYYNYTFCNIIKDKKHMEDSQLFYCLKSLVTFACLLLENKINQGDHFKCENIFLSLKGNPTFYLFNNLQYNHDEQTIQSPFLRDITTSIISIANLKQFDEMQTLSETRNIHLSTLLNKMLFKQVSIHQIVPQIQQLSRTNKIKIANSVKLTKFKALIAHSTNRRVSEQPIVPIKTQIKSQSMSRVAPLDSFKHLELKKSENQAMQQRMKQRMQSFLGKENFKINRSTNTSQKKTERKHLPVMTNWESVKNSTYKKKVFI